MRPEQIQAVSSIDLRPAGNHRKQLSAFRTMVMSGTFVALGLILIGAGCLRLDAEDSVSNRPASRGKKETSKPKASVADQDADSKNSADDDGKKDDLKKDDAGQKPKVIKTNAEWRKILKPEQYRVTRLKQTEQPFANKFWDNKKHGKYLCVCCGEELYRSDQKFDSGTGWPSFWAAVSEKAIGTEVDYAGNSVRTEVHCERCGGHLGHIFDDGPQPTGMRHCINSASLKFVPADSVKTK